MKALDFQARRTREAHHSAGSEAYRTSDGYFLTQRPQSNAEAPQLKAQSSTQIMLQIHDEKIPLTTDESGTIHVAGTRVTLECVAEMFEEGASAEEIGQQYDAVKLDDVYAVITYLLRNRGAVDAYLSQQEVNEGVRCRAVEERFPNSLRLKLLRAKREQESGEG